jgi:hypothetical protein
MGEVKWMLSFPLLLYYMGQGVHIVQMADVFSRALDYPLLVVFPRACGARWEGVLRAERSKRTTFG